jgi:acetoacetate decarboxylase
MFLDDDPPIAGGRELWGFPKKLAPPALKVERDTLVGTLDFGPTRIAIGTMGYKHEALPPEAVMPAMQESGFLLYDHRVMDGATIARALRRMEEILNSVILEEVRSLPRAAAGANGQPAPKTAAGDGA